MKARPRKCREAKMKVESHRGTAYWPWADHETALLFLLLLLVLLLGRGIPLRFRSRRLGLGRFARLLDGRSLGRLAQLGSRGRVRSSHGFRRHRRLPRRGGLHFGRRDRCNRSRRNFSLPLSARLAARRRGRSNSGGSSLGSSAPLSWRRWWRRR